MFLYSKPKRNGLHSIPPRGEFSKSTRKHFKTLKGISNEIKKDILRADLHQELTSFRAGHLKLRRTTPPLKKALPQGAHGAIQKHEFGRKH
jgi:hypothetical protein